MPSHRLDMLGFLANRAILVKLFFCKSGQKWPTIYYYGSVHTYTTHALLNFQGSMHRLTTLSRILSLRSSQSYVEIKITPEVDQVHFLTVLGRTSKFSPATLQTVSTTAARTFSSLSKNLSWSFAAQKSDKKKKKVLSKPKG